MSICRFVTDDWNSDVHVYQTGNGINIETAGFRLRFTPNHPYPHGDMTRLTLDGHPHEAARLAYEQAEACRHAGREPIQDRWRRSAYSPDYGHVASVSRNRRSTG